MTCPYCRASLVRRARDRVHVVCRRPWISAGQEGITLVMDCIACRRQVRIQDLAAALREALADNHEPVSTGA